MSELILDPKSRKLFLQHVKNRLHTIVQTEVIPFCEQEVHVDTGRLRASIEAEYPEYDDKTFECSTEVTFGGNEQSPTARDDGQGSIEVDYAASFEELTNNISEDILFRLYTQF